MIALAIKLDSRGPIFYRQQRVGKDGRQFWMFKFRSMCHDADRRLAELRDAQRGQRAAVQDAARSAGDARRALPAPLEPGRAAAAVQRAARRDEPGWSSPAAAVGGRSTRTGSSVACAPCRV